MLADALENAIEAASGIGNAVIRVSLMANENHIDLQISNPVVNPVKIVDIFSHKKLPYKTNFYPKRQFLIHRNVIHRNV